VVLHKLWWASLLASSLGAEEIARIMRHGPKGKQRLPASDRAGRRAQAIVRSKLGSAGFVLDRDSVRVPDHRTRFPAGDRADIGQVSVTQGLPGRAIVGEEDVAGGFENDQTQGKDVRRLVDLAIQDFWGDILAISFAFNTFSGWPLYGHTEVANFQIAVKGDEDVGRLQIKMNEACVVNRVQSLFLIKKNS